MSTATTDPFKAGPVAGDTKANGQARNAAYNEAVANLKAQFPYEWKDCYEEALTKRGLKYIVRLSAEERAEKEKAEAQAKAFEKIRSLAKENGIDLAEEFGGATVGG